MIQKGSCSFQQLKDLNDLHTLTHCQDAQSTQANQKWSKSMAA